MHGAGPSPPPLPPWLASSAAGGPCPLSGARAPCSFAERTLLALARLVGEESAWNEEAARPGLLQALDARAKVIAAAALLLAIATTRSIAALAGIAVLAIALAALSRLDAASYARRVWLVVPLFTAGIALPALFATFTPGAPLVRLGPATITHEGAAAAARLVLRAGASVSVVLLLARTTGGAALLKAIRAVGAPRTFALVLGMTHRYVFLFAREVREMHEGLRSRRLRAIDARGGRAFVGSRLAVLLAKAQRTAEDVHLAMVARGFRGEWRTLEGGPLRARDRAALAVAVALGVAVVLAPRAGLP